jgi:hypothetical protein
MPNKKKEDSMNIQTTPEETAQTGTPAGDATVHPLGEILDLFHTPQQEGYATIGVNSHRETWAL